MNKKKPDPRAHTAMDMTSNIFINSTTKFTPGLTKINLNNPNDVKLQQRALEAIQSKSPPNRRHSLERISQLGPGAIWQGMDKVPERTSKTPGNQQRLSKLSKDNKPNPQQQNVKVTISPAKNQPQQELSKPQKQENKPLQRQRTREAENQMNSSRIRFSGTAKGNLVSKDIMKQQSAAKDDFSIGGGEKSAKRERKYSNSLQKATIPVNNNKQPSRPLDTSRALSESKSKNTQSQNRINFSPSKIQQSVAAKVSSPQKAYVSTPVNKNTTKTGNKDSGYVYVPPQKRTTTVAGTEAKEKSEEKKPFNNKPVFNTVNSPRVSTNTPTGQQQQKVISKPTAAKSPTDQLNNKQSPKPLGNKVEPPKVKPLSEMIQQKSPTNQQPKQSLPQTQRSNNASSGYQYQYQPPVKKPDQTSKNKSPQRSPRNDNNQRQSPVTLRQQTKTNTSDSAAFVKTPRPNQKQSPQRINQNSPTTYVYQPPAKNDHSKESTSQPFKGAPKPKKPSPPTKRQTEPRTGPRQAASYTSIQLVGSQETTPRNQRTNTNVNTKQETSRLPAAQSHSIRKLERKNTMGQNSRAEEFKRDWSKIKETTKFNTSLSPSSSKRKAPTRQNVALNMTANLFMNASTRFFPGLAALIRKSSQQSIEQHARSTSQIKISIHQAQNNKDNKRATSPDVRPQTQRAPVPVRQEAGKRPNVVVGVHGKVSSPDQRKTPEKNKESSFNINLNRKSQHSKQVDVTAVQYRTNKDKDTTNRPKQNIVSKAMQKDNRKITRDDFLLNTQNASQDGKSVRSSIRESPDIFKRNVEESKKQYAQRNNQSSLLGTQKEKSPGNNLQSQQQKQKQSQSPQQPNTKKAYQELVAEQQKGYHNKSKEISAKSPSGYVYQPPTKKTQISISESENKSKGVKLPQTNEPVKKPGQKSQTQIEAVKPVQVKPEVKKPVIDSRAEKKPLPTTTTTQSRAEPKKINNNNVKNVTSPVVSPKNNNSGRNEAKGYVYRPPETKPQEATNTKNQNLKKVNSAASLINPASRPNVSQNTSTAVKPGVQASSTVTSPRNQNLNTVKSEKTLPSSSAANLKDKQITDKKYELKDSIAKSSILNCVLKKLLSSKRSQAFGQILSFAQRQSQMNKQAVFLLSCLKKSINLFQQNLKAQLFQKLRKIANKNISQLKTSKSQKQLSQLNAKSKQSAALIIATVLKQNIKTAFTKLQHNRQKKKQTAKAVSFVLSKLQKSAKSIKQRSMQRAFKQINSHRKAKESLLHQMVAVLCRVKSNKSFDSFSFITKNEASTLKAESKNIGNKKSNSNNIRAQINSPRNNSASNFNPQQQKLTQDMKLSDSDQKIFDKKQKEFERKQAQLQRKLRNLQREVSEHKQQKKVLTKLNSEVKLKNQKMKPAVSLQRSKSIELASANSSGIKQTETVRPLTKIYASLFQEGLHGQESISIEEFLRVNQANLSLPTNSTLINEWKELMRNAQLKGLVKQYEGSQPRQKRLLEIVHGEGQLMQKLLRSFIRERYIWEWVGIVSKE